MPCAFRAEGDYFERQQQAFDCKARAFWILALFCSYQQFGFDDGRNLEEEEEEAEDDEDSGSFRRGMMS